MPASLLELVNSDAGREVISGDQKIREMLAALGIKVDLLIPRPYTNEPPSIQPPPLRPSIEPPRKSTYPSIPPTHVYEVPKSEDLNPPLTGEIVTPPLNPPAQPSSPEPLLTQTRLQMELKKIEEAGYVSSGWSKETSQFDKNGQPLPGSVTWSLNVYIERADKYLTIAFHCPTNYPNAAPFVQTSPPGSKELREITPNTVATWHPGRFLVEIVREIDEWQI